jgi:hypothetical protein
MFMLAVDVCMSSRRSQRLPGWTAAYDFDPTTSPKKSGKTPAKQEYDGGFYRRAHVNREGMYVVGADSRRAEIVWWL